MIVSATILHPVVYVKNPTPKNYNIKVPKTLNQM
jgi:hypothetical protein